ncbi:acyltransferase-domain-containing protein [Syncephalis fuscata]|nr:acyltransferase-domain-containing protein [Syncephalis fuscata]
MAIGLNITQLLSILIAPFSRQTLIKINAWVAGTMWRAMQSIVERRNAMDITFSGDEVPEGESAIVVSNHGGLVDFYLVNALAVRKKMISHCSYFAKNSVKYVPFWGWGMWLCGMLMIKRNWLQDQKKIEAVFHRIRTWRPPVWVISFLEGTRLTPKKLAESQAFSQSRGLPVLRNLLAPRTKGFCETVRQLRGTHVRHVYDLTIAYWHCKYGYGHPPSLLRMHSHSMQGEYKFHVHVKRYAIEDLPEDDRGLTTWVHERFLEKDALLDELKASWIEHQDVRRIPLE